MSSSSLPADAHDVCTRIYLGSATAAQLGGQLADGRRVCVGCARTCHLPQAATPLSDANTPFSCACASDADRGPAACLFFARVLDADDAVVDVAKRARIVTALGEEATAVATRQRAATTPKFLARLTQAAKQVREQFESSVLQQRARDVIPIAALRAEAAAAHNAAAEAAAQAAAAADKESSTLVTSDEERAAAASAAAAVAAAAAMSLRDRELRALLRWFKQDFFTWVNAPPCDQCGAATTGVGAVAPSTDDEVRHKAGVVELYKCSGDAAHAVTRFPRYNDAGRLLETRRGRCGEWAQAFTLCARALDFEARFVSDWTDHVWTEVFSNTEQRWLHCDSCEQACDAPLLYEGGWSVPLAYVFSCLFVYFCLLFVTYELFYAPRRLRRFHLTQGQETELLRCGVGRRNGRRDAAVHATVDRRVDETHARHRAVAAADHVGVFARRGGFADHRATRAAASACDERDGRILKESVPPADCGSQDGLRCGGGGGRGDDGGGDGFATDSGVDNGVGRVSVEGE
jgi:hypothetical protein